MTYFSVHSKDNSFPQWNELSFFMFCCRFASRFYLSFNTMLTGLFVRMPMYFLPHSSLPTTNGSYVHIGILFAFFSQVFCALLFFSRYIHKGNIDKSWSNEIDRAIFFAISYIPFNDNSDTNKRWHFVKQKLQSMTQQKRLNRNTYTQKKCEQKNLKRRTYKT